MNAAEHIDFECKGWLEDYLEFRLRTPLPTHLPFSGFYLLEENLLKDDFQQTLYAFLQPTGLLYGNPLAGPFSREAGLSPPRAGSLGMTRMVFVETLCASLVADRHLLLGEEQTGECLGGALRVMMSFFLNDPLWLKREAPAPQASFSADWRKGMVSLERKLGFVGKGMFLRAGLPPSTDFLFLDLYACLNWQREVLTRPAAPKDRLAAVRAEQLRWQESLVRLLIVLGESGVLEAKQEQRLVNHFIMCSGLPYSTRRKLRAQLRSRRGLSSLAVKDIPWLVRRYFLELLLNVVLADRILSEAEYGVITAIGKMLGLWEEEAHQSLLLLETFMIEHPHAPRFVKSQLDIHHLHQRVQEQAAQLVQRHLDNLVNEIKETQELYALLVKATKTPLTRQEKVKVRKQLLDILKTVPALAVLALPAGGIILPVLIKLLPFNVLPSSFDDSPPR